MTGKMEEREDAMDLNSQRLCIVVISAVFLKPIKSAHIQMFILQYNMTSRAKGRMA